MNPIAPFQPAARPSRAEQDETRVERPRREASVRADFSALLAILAGAGPSVRTSVLQQLPPEGASLLDRLLTDVETGTDADPAASIDADAIMPGDAAHVASSTDVANAAIASDALRYGGIPQQPGEPTNEPRTGDARGNGSASDRDALAHMPPGARAAALDALARLTERRGASVEQLLALGDASAADLRATLDGILARAGTAEGAQLAGFAGDPGTDSAIAMATAAAALAAANVAARNAAAADVTTPVRDPGALAPEFRSRIERVMARMKNEYGHDVELVETTRSQERQDFLFEQGRTRPGQVVTWTRDSAHTRGEAVDVIVDGKWNNAEGYARLQRIAREEGLRTLGMRDPGHLEMPRDQRQADALAGDAARTSARIEGVTLPAAMSRRAQAMPAAPAAGVAGVASVAGVAGVARVAETSGTASASAPDAGAMAYTAAAVTRDAQGGNAGESGASGQESRQQGGRASASARKAAQADAATTVVSPSLAPAATVNAGGAVNMNAPAVHDARSADRVMELQDQRESAPGSVSRLTLSVDAPDGGSERITVDLRGSQVGTHITADAASAERMRARTGELQEALGRHGLDADTVRISTAARTDGTDTTRTAVERDALKLGAAQQSSQQDASAGNGQRERAPFTRDGQEQTDKQQPQGQQQQARQDARQDARQAREDAQRAALLQRAMHSHFNGNAR